MRKPVFGVSGQVCPNRAVQPQKMARGLKFPIYKVEGNLVLHVYAHAKIRFSHGEAHFTHLCLHLKHLDSYFIMLVCYKLRGKLSLITHDYHNDFIITL